MRYIVTGCSNGIGRCITFMFLKSGHEVYGIDIDDKGKLIEDVHDKFFFYKANIGDKKELDGFIKSVEYLRFDGIINNAGFDKGGIYDCSYEDFNYVLNVGLSAPFYLIKSLRDNLNMNSSIVNIASTKALMSKRNSESYAAYKGGLIALTHALSISLKGKARVNCISPGWINVSNENVSDEDKKQHPVERIGKPEDIAEMVMFLCSDKGSFIDGENIVIDGGMSKMMIYHGDNSWKYGVKE